MRVGGEVGHRVHDQRDIIAVVVSVARRRLDAAAGCHSGQNDLGHAAPAQDLFERRAETDPVAFLDRVGEKDDRIVCRNGSSTSRACSGACGASV